MDDDRKKPAGAAGRGKGSDRRGDKPRGGGPSAGPRGDAGKKPFRKREDGERRPYAKAAEGEKRPFRKRDDSPAGEGGQERKPYRSREEGGRKPFRKREDGGAAAPRPGRREREEGSDTASDGGERIARRLARAGVSSRREAEEMIAAGRVSLNGKVLESPAVNVSGSDRIELDGKEIPIVERTRLFLFHKPAGVVTTNRDPQGRRTVFDILPAGLPRLMTIGRLDINTEGLLLLTNDGGLSRVLELPATGWLRRYRARVHGKVELQALEALKEGIAVDGVFYGAIEATLDREQGSNAWLTLGFREGKNREVKNVLGAIGLDVTRLIRISYGPFQLGELAEGEVRELKGRLLRDQLGERLIAESGANFDAPIVNEFSNKPVAVRPPPRGAEGPERPNRKREREQKREDALGRLQTTRPARGPMSGKGGKAGGKGAPAGGKKRFEREERPVEEPRQRKANVWMAPGAKPMGEKKAAAVAERGEGRRYAGKPRPASARSDKPAPRPRGKGPGKPRGDR